MARVYQTYLFGEAQLSIAIVSSVGTAHLKACRVSSWGMARGDALWFLTKDLGQATVKAKFCSVGEAELRICFVPSVGQAGWLQPHRWQGRLG